MLLLFKELYSALEKNLSKDKRFTIIIDEESYKSSFLNYKRSQKLNFLLRRNSFTYSNSILTLIKIIAILSRLRIL
jgi:hypothetical protein